VVERNAGHPEAAARQLIAAANAAAGKDNVTVVLVEGAKFEAPGVLAPPRGFRVGGGVALAAGVILVMVFAAEILHRSQSAKVVPAIGPRILQVGAAPGGPSVEQTIAGAKAGDTIQFAADREYTTPLRLKSGVTFRGSQAGVGASDTRAILHLAPGTAGPAVLADSVHDVRIVGLRIVADQKAPVAQGILVIDSSVEIDDTEIEGATIGLEIRGASRLEMRASTIGDSLAEGLLASGPAFVRLSHNSFLRNHGSNLAARDGAQFSLAGNVFDKSTLELPAELKMDDVRERNFLLDAKRTRARHAGGKP
jgi:hypothetical protein